MAWSNEYIAQSIISQAPTSAGCAACQQRQPSTFVLAQQLPPLEHILSKADQTAKRNRRSHVFSTELASAMEDTLPQPEEAAQQSPTAAGKMAQSPSDEERRLVFAELKRPTSFEPFQVLRAIDKKNAMLLMEIRNNDFNLLLQPIGGVTPLVYCQRLGNSHREIAILLCGAFSRKVNDLTDEPVPPTGSTKSLLQALRTNLKLAVSSGLSDSAHDPNSTSLLASYLQIIVMSDPTWLRTASHKVALAARGGKAGKLVKEAEALVLKWASRELQKKQVAAVDAYIANATGDLVLCGLWSVATDTLHGQAELESWFFARDDRMAKALEERTAELKQETLYNKLSNLLRSQIEASLEVLIQRRNLSPRERVVELKSRLDG